MWYSRTPLIRMLVTRTANYPHRLGSLGKFVGNSKKITLVNTQNVSVTRIVDSSSIQHAETKYSLIIQFFALVFMINEVLLNA